MNTESLRYAGFAPRLAALMLDLVVLTPLIAITFWGHNKYRLFELYFFLPNLVFGLFFSVYLVRRFGGTPGKLMAGIRIRKLNGDPVGYREAFLRYLIDFALVTPTSIANIIVLSQMTDVEYHTLTFLSRAQRMVELQPAWYEPLTWILTVWTWSELIVLLLNRRRRALHDFLAGTVVVYATPIENSPAEEL